MSNIKMILLRGKENRGKTTLCAEVYRQLLKYARKEHLFGKQDKQMETVVQDSIKVNENGTICDFQALLSVGDKKVGFFSMGDYVPEYLKRNIQFIVDLEVDILVCCTRSRNRTNSTYRYYEETYGHLFKKIYWTEYAQNESEMGIIKKKQAENIVQYILAELKSM